MKQLSIGAAAIMAAWLLPATGVFAHWGNGDYYMHHMGFGGGFFGPFMMLVTLVLIVAVIVWAVRWLGGGGGAASERNRSLDILGERFAKGEIDQKEYDERRRALGN